MFCPSSSCQITPPAEREPSRVAAPPAHVAVLRLPTPSTQKTFSLQVTHSRSLYVIFSVCFCVSFLLDVDVSVSFTDLKLYSQTCVCMCVCRWAWSRQFSWRWRTKYLWLRVRSSASCGAPETDGTGTRCCLAQWSLLQGAGEFSYASYFNAGID